MTLEDRMLERYTRERQRGQGKKGLFNLEEGDDLDDLDEGNALGGLTHGGRSVLDLPGDDFMLQGLNDPDDEEKHIDRRTVQRTHFGGFQEPEDEEEQVSILVISKNDILISLTA
jgi:nucleolar protein 14